MVDCEHALSRVEHGRLFVRANQTAIVANPDMIVKNNYLVVHPQPIYIISRTELVRKKMPETYCYARAEETVHVAFSLAEQSHRRPFTADAMTRVQTSQGDIQVFVINNIVKELGGRTWVRTR
jgi:hypothetical protein